MKNHRRDIVLVLVFLLAFNALIFFPTSMLSVELQGRDNGVEEGLPISKSKLREPDLGPQMKSAEASPSSVVRNFTANERNYVFGCTKYVPSFHCDPIRNTFESWTIQPEIRHIADNNVQPDYVDSKYGKAVLVKADSLDFLRVRTNDLYSSPSFTVYLSFRLDNPENLSGELVSYTNQPHIGGWEIEALPSNASSKSVRMSLYDNSGSQFPASSTVVVTQDEFHDLVGLFDGRSLKLYLDGQLRSESQFDEFAYQHLETSLTFGAGSWCSCRTMSAIYDEFRYYNRTLSEQEIREINTPNDPAVEARSNPLIIGGILSSKEKPSGLLGLWTFDEHTQDLTFYQNDASYYSLIAGMAFAPDGRLFLTEKNTGNILIMKEESILNKPFATIPDIFVGWEEGLLSIIIDPRFNQNHYLYVTYNYQDEPSGEIYMRIARLTDDNGTGSDFQIIYDRIPSARGFHTGGAMGFNPLDDKLYVFVGDATLHESAQDLSSYYGKVLRLNRDGSIPSDNPFPDSPIFTYGHRNAYGLAFNDRGDGILAESGSSLYDEINYLTAGSNYGWPTLQPPDIAPEWFTNNTSEKPIRSYMQTPSPTQTIHYGGDKYASLTGSFILGSVRGDLYSILLDDRKQLQREVKLDLNLYPFEPVVAIAESPHGELYFAGYKIYKLQKVDYDSRDELMFPIVVNSTNLRISAISYDEIENKISLALLDESGPSTISSTFPAVYDNLTSAHYSVETTLADDGETMIELPHTVDLDADANVPIFSVELPRDYSQADRLKLTVANNSVSITKTVPEFEWFAVFALSVASLVIFTRFAYLSKR